MRGSTHVFHLAAVYALWTNDGGARMQRVNVEGTRNVLDVARVMGVQRVVHTSSIVAVGASPRPRILDETAAWDLGRLRIPYVTTKRQAEELALAASGPAA